MSDKSGLTAVDRFRRPTRSSNYGTVTQFAVCLFKVGQTEDDWGIQQVI